MVEVKVSQVLVSAGLMAATTTVDDIVVELVVQATLNENRS